MTYLRFHLIFNLPLLILLAALTGAVPWTAGEIGAFGLVLLAVMVFTSPWDNFAAKWGIWGFPREKYSLRIGYLPVEEYAFFLLQSANVMLAVRALFHFFPDWQTGRETEVGGITLICLAASVIPWAFVAIQLRWLRQKAGPRVNYAVHLAWFLPVIYTQWVLDPWLFIGHAGLLALVTATFGVYYTLADLAAVRAGTWFFDEKQITGVKLGGLLPWEEIAFFFLTSLLVAQSYLLLLPADLR
ncbi:MAG TPA: lycopene cyclase domain-containing protein [Candidatus Methylacidiphilales bacterium]|jgi:putative membrane protein|nr:lycopene cyclase domain-containing protein [Candidatus Methylacidiphilales bacterium]